MAAGATYTPIATITASGSASYVTFTAIPQTYTDLVMVIKATANTGAYMFMQVGNGSVDTGSNYSYTAIYGTGSSAGSNRNSNSTSMGDSYIDTSVPCANIYNFMNYSNTTTYKTRIMRNNVTNNVAQAMVNLWRSTAAIDTIKVSTDAGQTFTSTSTFTLYGIASA